MRKRQTKEDLKIEICKLEEEKITLLQKLQQHKVSTSAYERVENKIQSLRDSLEEEFKTFLECHYLNHSERRGVERYFAARIDRALLDILVAKYPF